MQACKRCLLYEMADAPLYERVQRTIDAIPSELRTEEGEYRQRLEGCKECDKLLSGMCRVCGCYVEVRAARKTSHCPKPQNAEW